MGINEYSDSNLNILKNAVNDADDMADKLFDLGFVVIKITNCSKLELNLAIDRFSNELKRYDVGLFYFSGHAFQINGENCLASADSKMNNDVYARETTVSLRFIIELMEASKVQIKIVILDACRNNPLPGNFRGASTNLAPVHAPQGTLIAFSTSPGERAEDNGMGRNSIYTGSILKHIDDPDIPIEALFKQVRISVVTLSRELQTPWEHTSLVGNFYFSSGGLVHASALPYDRVAVTDEVFESDGSEIQQIIEDLNGTDFRYQNSASDKISGFAYDPNDISMLFLLGRKLLSAAHFGAFHSIKKMEHLDRWVHRFNHDEENHVLNGILFEIYFDSAGKLRKDGFKANQLDGAYAIEGVAQFASSFEFIRSQLLPFRDHLLYLPNNKVVVIEANIAEEEVVYFAGDDPEKVYRLMSLKHETVELLHLPLGRKNINNHRSVDHAKFVEFVSQGLAIPKKKLRLITQYPANEPKAVDVPFSYTLSKFPGTVE